MKLWKIIFPPSDFKNQLLFLLWKYVYFIYIQLLMITKMKLLISFEEKKKNFHDDLQC